MEDRSNVHEVSYNSETELTYGDTNNEGNYPRHYPHGQSVLEELERNRQALEARMRREAQGLGAGKSKKKRSTKRTTKKKPKHTLKRKPKRKVKRKTNKK